jgi:hypothetical protein
MYICRGGGSPYENGVGADRNAELSGSLERTGFSSLILYRGRNLSRAQRLPHECFLDNPAERLESRSNSMCPGFGISVNGVCSVEEEAISQNVYCKLGEEEVVSGVS